MILWLTGQSGTGKTTLAEAVFAAAKDRGIDNLLMVDGDILRDVFGGDLGYSEEDRRKNMGRMARLCRYFDQQGMHAIAAVIAPFQETRDWNRANIRSYYEVYIRALQEDLLKRDPKGLYRRALAGETALPGINQRYDIPSAPDLIIDNYGSREEFLRHAAGLAALFQSTVGVHHL